MFTQSKKGFTLIELMVVIVIIGILAAVAIPKLFGMSAKAKASEVGAAAGTWAKLQQAYFMEMSDVGTIKLVGFDAPGKENAAGDCLGKTLSFCYTDDATNGLFKATPEVKLNECGTGDNWTLTFTKSTNADDPTIVRNGTVSTNCQPLTPSFCNIIDKKTYSGTACN